MASGEILVYDDQSAVGYLFNAMLLKEGCI